MQLYGHGDVQLVEARLLLELERGDVLLGRGEL
jgi:hypothetical protein